MIISRKGWVVVMLATLNRNPLIQRGQLFGPTIASDIAYGSENLCSNGLAVFPGKEATNRAVAERKAKFKKEGFRVRATEIDLRIAESPDDWESLREFGPYVVAVGRDIHDISLFGTAWIGRRRVVGAHDYWAPYYQNGLRPFRDFAYMVGERGLGVVSELARQSQERTRLISLRLSWPKYR